jgi:3-phenylpropionate/trans-cinnamate dioxygenase ferredoxin subunit
VGKRFVKVGKLADIPPGGMLAVEVDGVPVALCNVDGELFAVHDECTHECYPLTEGMLEGHVLTCALHGASFDVRNGEVLALPAYEPVITYEVMVEGDSILIAID